MESALSLRLQQARQRFFVGRSVEMLAWQTALNAENWPVPIWHIYGLGGIGKTSLLRQWRRVAGESGVQFLCLDAREFEPNSESFCAALREGLSENLGVRAEATSPQALCGLIGAISGRVVLEIDTFELLSSLDGWLRANFLPFLPANCAVTLAGRDPLPMTWRGDSGWWELVRSFNLGALSECESSEYLARRGIASGAQKLWLNWAHGHPLALSLAADVWLQQPSSQHAQSLLTPENLGEVIEERLGPADVPQLVGSLLHHLVDEVPSPAHRAALEACGIVAVMSEELLAEMLAGAFPSAHDSGLVAHPDSHALFEWVRGLSVMQSNRFGIFPHDLVREVLVADVRWRSPQWHGELHRSARNHYLRLIHQTSGAAQQRAIFGCIFLHRQSPGVAPYLHWGDSQLSLDVVRNGEIDEILRWIETHEGPQSRQIGAHWFALQPQNWLAVRDGNGAAQGFVFQLALQNAQLTHLEADPGALAAWKYLETHAPLRAGEGATLFRFWMDKTAYQSVSASQSLIFVQSARHHITTPHLAFSFFPCAQPGFWQDGFAYADFSRLSSADFEIDGANFANFGHDWRARPVVEWLELLSRREMQSVAVETPPEQNMVARSFEFLDETAFNAALRKALRLWSDGAALRRNPLLKTEMVHCRALQIAANSHSGMATAPSSAAFVPSTDEKILALRSLLREAVAALAVAPRAEKQYRALNLVYGRGILSQEAAADAMNVSHSSFRRYLRAALLFLGDFLWQRQNSRVEIPTGHNFPISEQNLNLF
ncbi:MAG TPA: hypothetical protein VGB45_13140 [Abditibacterium sp.]|jgi:hypothetical protein